MPLDDGMKRCMVLGVLIVVVYKRWRRVASLPCDILLSIPNGRIGSAT